MSDPIDLLGHSLGGAHAYIGAGILIEEDGIEVGSIITCGCPAPGGRDFARVVEPIDQRAYHNSADPVWLVPTQPPFAHPSAAIEINNPGPSGVFTNHRIALYDAGVPVQDKPFVDLMAAIYNPQPSDFDVVQMTSGVFWGLKRLGPNGRPAVTFRGSVTDEDWTRDFIALPIIEPTYWRLGMVHAGFAMGMSAAMKAVLAAL